jgi:hypothetical protein
MPAARHKSPNRQQQPDAGRQAPEAPGGRKRPWLLALAAFLLATWLVFLAALAWRG